MHILYATDGSTGALAAAEILAALPLDADSQLAILTVVREDEQAPGREILAAARATFSHSTAQLTSHLREGEPADEILRAAEEQRTDAILVGSSGHSAIARFFLGSVAERVARHARCAVLVARPLRADLHKIIVGLDGSAGAAQAVNRLRQFPLPYECEIRLVTVLPRAEDLTRTSRLLPLPLMSSHDAQAFIEQERRDAQQWLDDMAALFSTGRRQAVTEIRQGDPALALLEAADHARADLIVVGSQGHGALDRFLIGSVSEKVVRYAHCSVLVAR